MKPVYFQGLKKRPLFDEIVGYLETQQQMMKYPDRTATRIKDSHYYTNLDGQGGMSLADQAEKVQKERLMQEMIRQNVEHHYIGSDGARTPKSYLSIQDEYDIQRLIAHQNMADDLEAESQRQEAELQRQLEAKQQDISDAVTESIPTTKAQGIIGQLKQTLARLIPSRSGAAVGAEAGLPTSSRSAAVGLPAEPATTVERTIKMPQNRKITLQKKTLKSCINHI